MKEESSSNKANNIKPVVRSITDLAEISDSCKSQKHNQDELNSETKEIANAISIIEYNPDFVFPPVDLLRSSTTATGERRKEMLSTKKYLEDAIASLGVHAAIVGIIRGPTVTRYDIKLENGTKPARMKNLARVLTLALGVANIRIAPIPDNISTVGIEIPNKIVRTVRLRDIIDTRKFTSAKSKLSFAIGKGINGEGIIGNISKLQHMLIAGTTGSGKSVCINSLILSLLYKARPDEVKLIMIDPKIVDLGAYNGIPHLYRVY